MEGDVPIGALAELLAVSTMALATCGAEGLPHAAPVYFAAGEYSLGEFPSHEESGNWQPPPFYFFSDPRSQHARDLDAHPRAGAAIYPACFNWQDIHGLQIRGEVKIIEKGAGWDLGWRFYQAKFPFTSRLMDIVASNTLYMLVPNWLRLVDNRKGLGFKQEWERS